MLLQSGYDLQGWSKSCFVEHILKLNLPQCNNVQLLYCNQMSNQTQLKGKKGIYCTISNADKTNQIVFANDTDS